MGARMLYDFNKYDDSSWIKYAFLLPVLDIEKYIRKWITTISKLKVSNRMSFFSFRFQSRCPFFNLFPYSTGVNSQNNNTYKYILFVTHLITDYLHTQIEYYKSGEDGGGGETNSKRAIKFAINRFIDSNHEAWQWHHTKPLLLLAIQ